MQGSQTFPFPALQNPRNPFLGAATEPAGFAPRSAFAPAPTEVSSDAPEGSYEYALVQSAPAVLPEEVETDDLSIEITIAWGASILHVAHLSPPRPFYVGEAEGPGSPACDYALPQDALHAACLPVVLPGDAGSSRVVIPAHAKGKVTVAGQPPMTLEQAIASGLAQPCSEVAGAHAIPLAMGTKAVVEVGAFTLHVGATRAGRRVVGRAGKDRRALPFTGLSLAVHAAILAAAALFAPPLSAAEDEAMSAEQMYWLRQKLSEATQIPETENEPEAAVADAAPADRSGGTGVRATGEEGKMGTTASNDTNGRWGNAGPADNADPHLAKQAMLREAADFGMIGLLNAGGGGDMNAPTAPWGRDESLGNDPTSARGNMWGDTIADAAGMGGLGLTGVGEGAGGTGEGVGLGFIGTYGHGSGTGMGQGFGPDNGGIGSSRGFTRQGHAPSGLRMREGNTNVSGHIPPEVIQRIIRQNFGRFRLCYQNALRNNPSLQGRVSVRFVIGRDGAVSNVGSGGSDLPDPGVVSCVTRAFYGLQFPTPDGGIVTVTYPIVFSPG